MQRADWARRLQIVPEECGERSFIWLFSLAFLMEISGLHLFYSLYLFLEVDC